MVWEVNNKHWMYFYDILVFQFINIWKLRAYDCAKYMKTANTKISVLTSYDEQD